MGVYDFYNQLDNLYCTMLYCASASCVQDEGYGEGGLVLPKPHDARRGIDVLLVALYHCSINARTFRGGDGDVKSD